MAKYLIWVVGQRDETAQEIEAKAREAWYIAERLLGVPMGEIAMAKLPKEARHLSRDYQTIAYADKLVNDKLVAIELRRFRTRISSSYRYKRIAIRYKWYAESGAIWSEAWDNPGEAVGRAARDKSVSNIRLIQGRNAAERIVVRILARRHGLKVLGSG